MPASFTRMPKASAVILGHAIVDVLATVTDEEIAGLGLAKGTMELVDDEAAERIYAAIRPQTQVSGGSAANTAVCLASFGGSARFVGRVAADRLGRVFADDIRAAGVTFENPVDPTGGAASGEGAGDGGGRGEIASGPGSGRCLVLVSPDAEKTMCTSLGVGALIDGTHVPAAEIRSAGLIYMEGYVWGPEPSTSAARAAIAAARAGGSMVAFSASDPGWVAVQRPALIELLELSDLVFANEPEALGLAGVERIDDAVEWLLERIPQVVVTLGADGCLVAGRGRARVEVPAVPVDDVVDTTGAGDSFAGGYLFGVLDGRDVESCARLGSLAASEVVSHIGARPQVSLKELAARAGLL